jgi:hypothetical protein
VARGRVRMSALHLLLRPCEVAARKMESDSARWRQVEFEWPSEARTGYVVDRVLSGLAAEGMFARASRLGSLRAGSQVIRAH